jgi:hypothetical protein
MTVDKVSADILSLARFRTALLTVIALSECGTSCHCRLAQELEEQWVETSPSIQVGMEHGRSRKEGKHVRIRAL